MLEHKRKKKAGVFLKAKCAWTKLYHQHKSCGALGLQKNDASHAPIFFCAVKVHGAAKVQLLLRQLHVRKLLTRKPAPPPACMEVRGKAGGDKARTKNKCMATPDPRKTCGGHARVQALLFV